MYIIGFGNFFDTCNFFLITAKFKGSTPKIQTKETFPNQTNERLQSFLFNSIFNHMCTTSLGFIGTLHFICLKHEHFYLIYFLYIYI